MVRYFVLFIFSLVSIQPAFGAPTAKGFVDAVTFVRGEPVVRGWACVEKYNNPIDIHLYAGDSNESKKILLGARSDQKSEIGVSNTCQTSNVYHRYSVNLTKAQLEMAMNKKIFAFAINPLGPNPQLSNSGRYSFPSTVAKGYIDNLKFTNGAYILNGWACHSNLNYTAKVKVYVDDNGKPVEIAKADANSASEVGVNNACNNLGNHRFNIKIPMEAVKKYPGRKIFAMVDGNKISTDRELARSYAYSLPELPTSKERSIASISKAQADSYIFDEKNTADFNGDGVLDLLLCPTQAKLISKGNTDFDYVWDKDLSYKIIDGKTNTVMHELKIIGSEKNKVVNSRVVTANCEILEIEKNKPSVFIGTHRRNFYNNLKTTVKFRLSQQHIMLNDGKGNFEDIVVKKPASNNDFQSVARDVNCKYIDSGKIESAAYCFVASYATYEIATGVTFTSLLKLKSKNGKLEVTDLTPKSGLPWEGVNGTHAGSLEQLNIGKAYGSRRNQLDMMTGVVIDYNQDGLPDLITAGQHSSLSLFTMKLSPNAVNGIKFDKFDFTRPSSNGGPTEYIKISSVPDSLGINCVYISGEGNDREPNYVPDHFRCYDGKSWSYKTIAGENFSSDTYNAFFGMDSNGKLLVKSRERKPSSFGDMKYFIVN